MTYENILKLLDKYDIKTLDDLGYCLSTFSSSDECIDDPENNKKNCMNAQCYEDYFVPDCRRIVEIYKKYFQKKISKKKDFIQYLSKNISKNKSSIDNYMSCKSCNQQIKKGKYSSLKIIDSEFKKDFCNNLELKFNYKSIFETDYRFISQFLAKEHQITIDNFSPDYDNEDTMTKDEEKKLFVIVHTSKEKFKKNLNNKANLEGSDTYVFHLAKYAFDRGLVDECYNLLEQLNNSKYLKEKEFLQLKAKVLSSQNKNLEAIKILKNLIKIDSNLDSETSNLLAASIKRDAFSEYEKYGDEVNLIAKLKEAQDIYYSIYKLNNSYYPALNYIYLLFMLAHLNNEDEKYFKNITIKSKYIWGNIEIESHDWWDFIADIEFLILMGNYQEAQEKLKEYFNNFNKESITDFNISSTLRQLNLYFLFCQDSELKKIIKFIEQIYV